MKGKRVAWICGVCHTFNKEVAVCKKCCCTPAGEFQVFPIEPIQVSESYDQLLRELCKLWL